MATSRPTMGAMFCAADRTPSRAAAAMDASSDRSGLKGLPAAAGLLGIRIGDPEARTRQPVLVIDDRASEVNEAAIFDKKFHPESLILLVARLLRRNFHGVGHAGAAARFDINAEALALRVRGADDLGDVLGGALGHRDG